MKKEKLIEELQKLPANLEVCIVDWRKNLNCDDGEGSGVGITPDFEIEAIIDPDICQEGSPFIALNFNNYDYNEDGTVANL